MFSRCQTRRHDPFHSQKKNHTFALVRPCVMLLIPTGLQAFIQSRWKRNNDSIRRYWQMEVTRSKKSFHEPEFRMNMHTCIFFFPNAHIVEVLLREHIFSTGGRQVVLGFSLMAQFSCWDIKSLPLLLFFCTFSNTQTLTQWLLQSLRLSGNRKQHKANVLFVFVLLLSHLCWGSGFRGQLLCTIV